MNWYERLLRQKVLWEERLLIRQREALFRWVETQGVIPNESVIVALADDVAVFFHVANEWRKQASLFSEMTCRFVLCEASLFSLVQAEYKLTGEWQRIFQTKEYEVWESKAYYQKQNRSLPLRLGLDDAEKTTLLSEVRRMMGEVLSERETVLMISGHLRERLNDRQNLDVAVWVEGRLRASVIVTDQPGHRALEVAAKRATWDKRFAPLTPEEFPGARIEITLMSDLFFPVFEHDFRRGDIDPAKGYRVTAPDGKCGWYLPEVHNCVSFRSLSHMLEQLTMNKAAIHPDEFKRCLFEQFSTFDWIENDTGVMTLSGPTETPNHERISTESYRQVLQNSLAWLGRIQKADGSMAAVFTPHDTMGPIRLPALGGVGHALAVAGRVLDDAETIGKAERIWQYIATSLEQEVGSKPHAQLLFSLVYFLRLSLELKKEVAQSQVELLVSSLYEIRSNPILWLQILSFLADYEAGGFDTYADLLRKEMLLVGKVFQKRRVLPDEQVALYPEWIAVCARLFVLTGDESWKERGIEASQWYRSVQQEDGSFPHSPKRIFAYTRGTSKIFEALAAFPEENEPSLRRAFAWIRTLQYDQANTFHLAPLHEQRLCGGFRHDAFNKEVWIDASAHVILGLARILKK